MHACNDVEMDGVCMGRGKWYIYVHIFSTAGKTDGERCLCICLFVCLFVCVFVEDPFRGCVSSRSVGPRQSGDFVVMGCMQV